MLDTLKRYFWKRYLIPFLSRRNWRPSEAIPTETDYLQAFFGFDEEELIKAAVSKVRNKTDASFERLATLWQQVRYLDRYKIPGSLVECGVRSGGCVGLMALAHLHSNPTPPREIHLFDSFQGRPEPDAEVDGIDAIEMAEGKASGRLVSIETGVASVEDNHQFLVKTIGYPEHLIKYHVGWFQDTLPRDVPLFESIALLRLDGDWYASTIVCLNYLYSHVSQYGVVVIDDYGHFDGCRKATDEFIGGLDHPILLSHVDYSVRCWVKGVESGTLRKGGHGL